MVATHAHQITDCIDLDLQGSCPTVITTVVLWSAKAVYTESPQRQEPREEGTSG